MIELAFHVLDIAENSIRAEANLIEITIAEDLHRDRLVIEIRDNGRGMTNAELARALDPFFTTKRVRRIGLGLPMLSQAAEITGGTFSIESAPNIGTWIRAEFVNSHLDRQPIGDLPGTIVALILAKPEIDILYRHLHNERVYTLDTREIRSELGEIPLNHREVVRLLRRSIKEGLQELAE